MDNRTALMLRKSKLAVSLTISFWALVAAVGLARWWEARGNFTGLLLVFVASLGVGVTLYGTSFLTTPWRRMSRLHRALRVALGALACALVVVAVFAVKTAV
jgi:hypothetical protein